MPKPSNQKIQLNYFPAELKICKSGWTIVYYVQSPGSKKMIRKRIKVNRIKNKKERLKYSRQLIKKLNSKLAMGWNPFIDESGAKGYIKLNKVLQVFLEAKARELRPDSIRTYKSYSKIFLEYVNEIDPEMFAVDFTENHAADFMLKLYQQRNLGNNTYNNYLLGYRVIFNWMKNTKYLNQNPFQNINKKKSQHKRRRILTDIERSELYDYYQGHNERYLTMILLAFHALIRPTELTFLKPGDIDFKRNVIVPPQTKNGNTRVIATPEYVMKWLKRIGVQSQPSTDYIFSSGFRNGSHKLNARKIFTEWERGPRKKLGFGKDVTFYSLRDSGIVQMLRDGIELHEVQKHADHANVSTTQKYINIAFPKGVESVREKSSRF